MASPPLAPAKVHYASSDGRPMAESDFQRTPLIYAVDRLRHHFRGRRDVVYSFNMFGDAVRPARPAPARRHRPLLRSPARAADMNATAWSDRIHQKATAGGAIPEAEAANHPYRILGVEQVGRIVAFPADDPLMVLGISHAVGRKSTSSRVQ